jgi:hypothetical protein
MTDEKGENSEGRNSQHRAFEVPVGIQDKFKIHVSENVKKEAEAGVKTLDYKLYPRRLLSVTKTVDSDKRAWITRKYHRYKEGAFLESRHADFQLIDGVWVPCALENSVADDTYFGMIIGRYGSELPQLFLAARSGVKSIYLDYWEDEFRALTAPFEGSPAVTKQDINGTDFTSVNAGGVIDYKFNRTQDGATMQCYEYETSNFIAAVKFPFQIDPNAVVEEAIPQEDFSDPYDTDPEADLSWQTRRFLIKHGIDWKFNRPFGKIDWKFKHPSEKQRNSDESPEDQS